MLLIGVKTEACLVMHEERLDRHMQERNVSSFACWKVLFHSNTRAIGGASGVKQYKLVPGKGPGT